MASTSALAAPRSLTLQKTPPHLLDLHHLLSLEGFEASIWGRLGRESRGTFNLTCRKSRQLVDLLVSSVTLRSLRQPVPGSAWTSAERFAAFLQRLPRLTSLHLHRTWPTEVDLVALLKLCEGATQGRVTQVTLHETTLHDREPKGGMPLPPQLFHAGLDALSRACPRLRELELVGPPDEDVLQLQGAIFLPFHDQQLVQLTTRSCSLSGDVLASLRGLTSLTSLRALGCTSTDPRQLHLLGSLPHLQHCELELSVKATLGDAAPLFDATRLTSLRVWKVGFYHRGAASAAEQADALARLSGLLLLRSLDLGHTFRADDAVLAALGRLTQLTRLCVGRIACQAPVAAGRLPQLQALQLGMEDDAFVPSTCLESLLPLLPLSSLTTLGSGTLVFDIGVDVEEDVDADAAECAATAAAAQAATLRSLLQHLAAVPRLPPLTHLVLQVGKRMRHPTAAQIADALQPLAAPLHTLALWGVDLSAADWGMVQHRVPSLTNLQLDDDNSASMDLAAAVRHLTKLRSLNLFLDRLGFVVHDASMWLRLAEECSRPLRLGGDCQVAEEVVEECRRVQARVHGVQHIDWP